MSNRAPIKYTCPDIDKLQKRIKQMRSDLKYYIKNVDDNDLKRDLDSWDDELYSISDDMEDLRSSNDALRQWGTEMADKCDELENTIEELKINATA